MRTKLSIFLLALGICGSATAQVKLLRHPTYSKGKVAFSYLGDIWIANENGSGVTRLTDNTAREIYPRFSPDGKWIAFSSNREGNYGVYVIPTTGGKPKQLTWHSADDNVVGWTPDSKKITFSSTRGNGVFPNVTTLWEVPADGGIEVAVETDWGIWSSYSADGRKMAFTRHPQTWSRKHYRGSYAADLWVEDQATRTFTKLGNPEYKGNMLWPMYGTVSGGSGDIYFVSNEMPNEKTVKPGSAEVMKSVNNIWKVSDKGGRATQVTRHEDGNLFFPSISADGKVIVYEDNFGLWKLDVASGKSTEIRIEITTDPKENEAELITLNSTAQAFSLSPSNRRAAVVAHGEIFTVATDRGEPQRVSDTAWKEQEPRWSPDGKWIAFVSDRTGREEVFISDELGKNPKKLTMVDCDKTGLVWAPDSKSLLWSGSDHKLRRVEIESGNEEILASNEAGNIVGAQFSPGGKWISYSKQDTRLRAHVYVKELATGQEHVITSDEFQTSSGAKWTADGRKLLFLGGITVPGIAQIGRGTAMQLFSAAFQAVEKDPTNRDINTEAQAEAPETPTPGPGRAGRGGQGATPPVQIKIDWEALPRRITQLTRLAGSVGSVTPSPDGRMYLVSTQGDGFYVMNEDGSGITRLNTTITDTTAPGRGGRGGGFGFGGGGGEPQWTRDNRGIYFLSGGGLYTVAVTPPPSDSAPAGAGGRGGRGGGAGRGGAVADTTAASGAPPRRVNFTLRMEIDTIAEQRQVFAEAWRVMKNRFYDAGMHGVNWSAAKDKYESLLPHVADLEELHNLIMEMIGELNASHTGITGGSRIPGENLVERVQTRYPGFNLEPDASGFYKISRIYRKGPADHEYLKLATGYYVLAVNDHELTAGENYWKLFNVLPGRKFDFVVNSKPSREGAWNVAIEPINTATFSDLQYAQWVEDKKQMVAKLSNGEYGYLHIRAMDEPSLRRFETDLLANQDKKGLIIDERFNGGGGIDQELLELLNQRVAYQKTRGRDSVDLVRPGRTYMGPMVVLQNERSASDAEMFPDGFRRLGLGKIVGMPTYGAVIGTGSFTLLDGSAIRTPGAGVYTATGENMENYGVPPDVLVDNTPADFLSGHDRQIEKALEVLKAK